MCSCTKTVQLIGSRHLTRTSLSLCTTRPQKLQSTTRRSWWTVLLCGWRCKTDSSKCTLSPPTAGSIRKFCGGCESAEDLGRRIGHGHGGQRPPALFDEFCFAKKDYMDFRYAALVMCLAYPASPKSKNPPRAHSAGCFVFVYRSASADRRAGRSVRGSGNTVEYTPPAAFLSYVFLFRVLLSLSIADRPLAKDTAALMPRYSKFNGF
mmetsp:Transcript_65332/g.181156  ORF Transcript_65332/g.181156 Transcript_65332/m.181156 type:complete len:208 (-) Transcript_65332:12-635(-)